MFIQKYKRPYGPWVHSKQTKYLHNSSNVNKCFMKAWKNVHAYTTRMQTKEFKRYANNWYQFSGKVKIQLLHKDKYFYNIAVLIFKLS